MTTEFVEQVLLLVTTPLYVLVIGLHWGLCAWHSSATYSLADTATNLYLSALNGALEFIMGGATLWLLSWPWLHRGFHYEATGIYYWLALFVLEDFFYYFLHYVDHHCRLFWATHVTHHSSEYFNFSTGFRASVFQPLYRLFYFAPIVLLGFQPADVLLMYSATQIFGTFVHHDTCGKLGPLEWIFVTPSHHRLHHGSNQKYLDKNIGMTLIIWDRLFGTFVETAPKEPVRYGLTNSLASRGPINIVVHEWKDMWRDVRDARTWRERINHVLGRPR